MPQSKLRILHAIHDFLPRHRAGSEIYAFDLCKELASRHHVTIACAEYDPARGHGQLTWRMYGDLPVVELVNNWTCDSFADTYRSPIIGNQIEHVLRMVQPDVIHLHSLLNLSFDLPARAQSLGIPVVATLHDYTLVCASGGQRLHRAEQHLCDVIDTDRCARCFRESPFHSQMSFGSVAAATGGASLLHRAVVALNRRAPQITGGLAHIARYANTAPVTKDDIDGRMAAARQVFDDVDMFVAPSASIATEFCRLGLDRSKVRVSDYGFVPLDPRRWSRWSSSHERRSSSNRFCGHTGLAQRGSCVARGGTRPSARRLPTAHLRRHCCVSGIRRAATSAGVRLAGSLRWCIRSRPQCRRSTNRWTSSWCRPSGWKIHRS